MKKVLVSHIAKQHSLELSEALDNTDKLHSYITTVYVKKDTRNWTSVIQKFLKGNISKRANNRKSDLIDEDKVYQINELGGLFTLFLMRVDKSSIILNYWSEVMNKNFGKKVARYAIKNKVDAVVMFDTNAYYCFKELIEKAPDIKRILDVSSATHRFMKNIYQEDMKNNPEFSKSLLKSSKYFWSEKKIKKLTLELSLAQFYITPSNFSGKSLEYEGISSEKIFICPYGTSKKEINLVKNYSRSNDKKIKFIYVGSLTQRKGIGHLLKAFEKINGNLAELYLVGNYDKKDDMFKPYLKDKKYKFTGHLPHDQVINLLKDSDVMVFPSLSDSYSLAVLEALSSGLPVIATNNTGASELIINSKNGFVVPISDSKILFEKMNWFIENKEKIANMSKNAVESTKVVTWNNYSKEINKVFDEILN